MPSPPSLPSKTTYDQPSLTLASQDVIQGCILWLGDEQETIYSYTRREGATGVPVVNFKSKLPANGGMYCHPIIVISRPLSDPNIIYFHQMTSFAGKSLVERCSGRKAAFRQQTFCPITPAPDHPQLVHSNGRYRTLTLENGDVLEKPSYVNVREVYRMDWRDAQPYWGADSHTRKTWKLDTQSIISLSRLTLASAAFRAEVQHRPPLRVEAQKDEDRNGPSEPLDLPPVQTLSPTKCNPEAISAKFQPVLGAQLVSLACLMPKLREIREPLLLVYHIKRSTVCGNGLVSTLMERFFACLRGFTWIVWALVVRRMT